MGKTDSSTMIPKADSGLPPRLLTAARTLFAERGYHGASMSELADRVGIRKPSLYGYISSKEELLIEVVDASVAEWRSANPMTPYGDSETWLRGHMEQALDHARSHRATVAVLQLAGTQLHGELKQRLARRIEAYWRRYFDEMVGFFDRALEMGDVEPGSSADRALFWCTTFDGMLISDFHIASGIDVLRTETASLWPLLWRGLSGREPHTGAGDES